MQNFSLSKRQVMDNVDFFRGNSDESYSDMVRKIIVSKPFDNNKFYIFQFVKRVDDLRGIKKMFHHPRLTKPEPIPGSTLLRCDPNDPEYVKIIWTLPNEENFSLYKKGKIFENEFVFSCIEKYLKNPSVFMQKEDGDLSEEQIKEFYLAKAKPR